MKLNRRDLETYPDLTRKEMLKGHDPHSSKILPNSDHANHPLATFGGETSS